MNGRTVGYCFKQGVVNIKRNKLFSIASICTIAACIFLIGIILSIIINVNSVEKQVEQNVGVTVFFDKGLKQEQIDTNTHQQRKLGRNSREITSQKILNWQRHLQMTIH